LITNQTGVEIDALKSNQEEADTRICLHAKYAAENGAECIVVSSPDTDVLVLVLHHRSAIPARNIFFLTGREGKHANLSRFIPLHEMHSS
jgi:hypothetical protein